MSSDIDDVILGRWMLSDAAFRSPRCSGKVVLVDAALVAYCVHFGFRAIASRLRVVRRWDWRKSAQRDELYAIILTRSGFNNCARCLWKSAKQPRGIRKKAVFGENCHKSTKSRAEASPMPKYCCRGRKLQNGATEMQFGYNSHFRNKDDRKKRA